MRFNQFRFILPLLTILFLSSCLGTTDVTTSSTDARFISLTFGTNDSIPNISTAKFTLMADSITIVNTDSLPFLTRIDSVYPTFTFVSSSRATLFFQAGYKYNKDSAVITGKDTIDFRKPVNVRNYAGNGIAYKDYQVKVKVHQVNPELYIWSKISNALYSQSYINQRTVLFKNKFFYYANDGLNNSVLTSANGNSWTSETLSGMPLFNSTTNIVEFNSNLFFTQDGANVFSSVDGLNWTKADYTAENYNFVSLMFTLNGQIWAVTKSKTDQTYHFANSTNGSVWIIRGLIPDNFPVVDYSSLLFSTRTGKPKVLVLGGYSTAGTLLSNRWSTEDGAYWVDFSTENTSLPAIAGASVVSYDSKLLLFGGKDGNNDPLFNPLRESKDEGLTWTTPDSTKNYLPTEFLPRYNQSAILDSSNRIFIVGGQNKTTIFTDVWTGKLNRKSFIIQ